MAQKPGKLENRLIGPAIRRNSLTLHIVGLGLLMVSAGMAISTLIEWGSSESHNETALLIAAVITAIFGGALWFSTEVKEPIGTASIFASVAWTWIACSVFGALPYILAGDIFNWGTWDSALFESISGFSCTGSTVLPDIESLGRGVLFWRQLTQWYGGMGMVVLAVSVLPYVGVGGLGLVSAESPGQTMERLAPRVSETARRLWILYVGITLTITLALLITPGPNLYDSFAHALSVSSTGGFSPNNLSIGQYDSLAVELVISFFLIYCALSFNLHYRALRGDFKAYGRQKDQTFFLKVALFAILAVTLLNWNSEFFGSLWSSLRHSVFNVATLISSGGFSNATGEGSGGDFALWAPGVQLLLLLLMVMGGSVGSTAGGLKAYRVYVSGIHVKSSLKKALHPNLVQTVRLGKTTVPPDIVRKVLGFVTLYVLFVVAGTLVVASLGSDLVTAFSGALSAMSNMGPALGEAGPTSNFLEFSRPARGVLMFLMLVGRLEILAILFMLAAPFRYLGQLKGNFFRFWLK